MYFLATNVVKSTFCGFLIHIVYAVFYAYLLKSSHSNGLGDLRGPAALSALMNKIVYKIRSLIFVHPHFSDGTLKEKENNRLSN